MKKKLVKIGNGYGVIINKPLLDYLNVRAGDEFYIDYTKNEIVLTKVQKS